MNNYEYECIGRYLKRLQDPIYLEHLKEQVRNVPIPTFNYILQPERLNESAPHGDAKV